MNMKKTLGKDCSNVVGSCRNRLTEHEPKNNYLQQTLVCLLLICLVGYVRQIDSSQGRAVIQDYVTHIKTENVFLQPVLQVLKEPTDSDGVENTLKERHISA